MSRRDRLGYEDFGANPLWTRADGRYRFAARSCQFDGNHSGHDDLRIGRWCGVAGEECDHEVPARVRRVYSERAKIDDLGTRNDAPLQESDHERRPHAIEYWRFQKGVGWSSDKKRLGRSHAKAKSRKEIQIKT